MIYFIALIMMLIGWMLISAGRLSLCKEKDINDLVVDGTNVLETEGFLKVIEIRSTRYSFECDCEVSFKSEKGRNLRYNKTFFGLDSRASFLRKCERRGEVPVTIIYDKSSSARFYIEELNPQGINSNGKKGFCLLGSMFILLGLFIIASTMHIIPFMHL
ncbi:hypothetical protein [Mogibacterium diversum]|uniref:hypothetical protein n=1 Tax=Mogibacterium diversum TaxID=114527 RepID=UPI0028D7D17A|nr:hypothetical protein [Mogibacterium diversum]